MARTIDAEDIVDSVTNVLKANLNTKIAAINAEKNDATVLATIDANAYAFHEMNGRVMAYDPFVVVGIDQVESEGRGPMTSMIVTMNAIIVLADSGQDAEVARRLWRYQRALREVIQSNYSDRTTGARFEVSGLEPIAFRLTDSDTPFKAVGVQIRAGIG